MKHNVLYSRCFPSQGEYYTTRVKEKTSAQHQQPHKNQEYPHKRKLPFLPKSAAADTINTQDLEEDNSDAIQWQCLWNLQRQWCLSWKYPKRGIPKPRTPSPRHFLHQWIQQGEHSWKRLDWLIQKISRHNAIPSFRMACQIRILCISGNQSSTWDKWRRGTKP